MARRTVLSMVPTALVTGFLVACSDEAESPLGRVDEATRASSVDTEPGRWRMPAEEEPHERTWMCWPSSEAIWGDDLGDVQDTIVAIALSISEFEPVTVLARPEEIDALTAIFGGAVELLDAPVDDLWARDTLPNFVVRSGELAASHATFNGWGDKQIHSGDAQLASDVAVHLGIDLFDSGLVGEGGAIEIDGTGTVLAAESCWVNDNRNPGKSRDEIETAILEMVGADRMIWVDGLAGADITDGHIDTLARFAGPTTIVIDKPAFADPDDPWVEVADRTAATIRAARTADGRPYEVVEIVQPSAPRGDGDTFLSTYMNYYVCNGAVIAPEFGDPDGDAAARAVLERLFPDRQVVMLDIDPLAAGGGGIHCATQQQPRIT